MKGSTNPTQKKAIVVRQILKKLLNFSISIKKEQERAKSSLPALTLSDTKGDDTITSLILNSLSEEELVYQKCLFSSLIDFPAHQDKW